MEEDGRSRKRVEDTFICELCEKKFTTNSNLVRHSRNSCSGISSKREKTYQCKYCHRYYATQGNLNKHLNNCSDKTAHDSSIDNENLKKRYKQKIKRLQEENQKLRQELKSHQEEIIELKVKYEAGKKEVYREVCTKVLDKSTVTNNTAYIHPKLVNLPITNIQPLTEDYVKDKVSNGGYTFDNYLKGENGLVDFIYSITMCENDDGAIERNYVCTDPSRDSYHRLVETKEWQKDKGGKFVDVILDTLSDKVDDYHHKMLDERISKTGRKSSIGYDPDYIYKLNTDMHSGVVQSRGKDRRLLRQKIKKETSRKISV